MHPTELIKSLRSISGNTTKSIFLLDVQETLPQCIEDFKLACTYALDTAKQFHTKKVNLVDVPSADLFAQPETKTWKEVLPLLDALNEKGSCNAADQHELDTLFTDLESDCREFVEMIIARNFRCGVTLNTLRKDLFGADFLPAFPCELCSSYDKKRIQKNINFDPFAYSQLKSDGARGTMVKFIDERGIKSRNGKRYYGLHRMEKFLADFIPLMGFALDGEFVVLDEEGNILPRQTGNGILAKSIKGKITPEEQSRVRFIVWDLIPECEFKGTMPDGWEPWDYEKRLNNLRAIVAIAEVYTDLIRLTPTRKVTSLVQAAEHFNELVAEGEEGTILKDIEGVWGGRKSSRSSSQYKFKEEFDVELKITDWYRGTKGSKYENCIGGFTVQSACGQLVTNVGMGLSDEVRGFNVPLAIEEHAEQYIDAIVSVKFNALIKAKDSDIYSLFSARIIDFRFDKDTADTLEDIQEMMSAQRELNTGG